MKTTSRTTITASYAPLNEDNDRLDAHGKTVQPMSVSANIFNEMGIASRIVRKTGYESFPDGPGNQEAAIWMSGGRSWTRMKLARDIQHSGQPKSAAAEIQAIKEIGGGNCGEHRRMVVAEYSQVDRTLPVFHVRESNEDHHYAIVGDWRDRNIGDHAVVVDAYPMIKKVFTYGERKNRTEPVRIGVLPPGPAEPSSDLRVVLDKEPYDALKMDRFTKMRLKTQAGPDAAKVIIKGMRGNGTAWNEAETTNNLFRAYVTPDGNSSAFNDVPQGYVDNYLRAREEIKRELPVKTTD